MIITLTLPWPPSVNHYFKIIGNRLVITPAGKAFRDRVYLECLPFQKTELYEKKLNFFICAFPPDRRKRDLDNILKALQDAIQYGQVYKNDFQIDCLYIKRMPDLLGHVVVKIYEITED